MAAVTTFYPGVGSLEEWNAAYYRLEDYLRAHSVVNKIHQSQIILRLLARAASKHALDSTQDPIRLALEEAYQEIEQWFQRTLPDQQLPPQRLSNAGRVSMYIIDATERWPNLFLADGELPPDFLRAIQETSLQSGPDLRISSMVPRPLDSNPLTEVVEETPEKLGRLLVALLVGLATLFAGLIALS